MSAEGDTMNYITLAKDLIADGRREAMGRRYLDVRRRHRIVRNALKAALAEARSLNPLQGIIRVPLSLAGRTDSKVLAHGEYLLKRRIPIALAFDSRGRHLGMPLDEVMAELAQVGEELDDHQILKLYEDFMAPPSTLLALERPKIAKLPRYADQLAILRAHLEEEMVKPIHHHRFAAVVEKNSLAALIRQIPKSLSVVLSFHEDLLINGKTAKTEWGLGNGLAVVARADLAQVLEKAQCVVTFEMFDDFWAAWPDSGPCGAPDGSTSQRFQFDYFTAIGGLEI